MVFFIYFYDVFVRKKHNKSGSISIQIISKSSGKFKLIETIGSSFEEQEIAVLFEKGKQRIKENEGQFTMFADQQDAVVESFLSELHNAQARTIGPELVFGKIYDHIGYGKIMSRCLDIWLCLGSRSL